MVPIKTSILDFFPTGLVAWLTLSSIDYLNQTFNNDNQLTASFKNEDFYNDVIAQHEPNFWTTGQMTSNHGTCTNNAKECKRVTVNSNICYSRDDVTSQTPHADIQVNFYFI